MHAVRIYIYTELNLSIHHVVHLYLFQASYLRCCCCAVLDLACSPDVRLLPRACSPELRLLPFAAAAAASLSRMSLAISFFFLRISP